MDFKHEFQSKAVIVTGGAQGIGRGITEAFAKTGAHVAMLDINLEAGMETEAALKEQNLHVRFIQADVADETSVRTAVQAVLTAFGRVDVLVNNAGIGAGGSLLSRSVEEFDRVIAINLRGPYMMAKYCAEALAQANPGAIINLASTRALMSEANTEPYSASKGGIVALTHSLAVSLGPKVRVNAISPGWIEVGPWQQKARRTIPHHSPQDLSQHPVGRVGTPEDIAQACLYLASDAAGFITGQNFVIDGGMTIKMIYEP